MNRIYVYSSIFCLVLTSPAISQDSTSVFRTTISSPMLITDSSGSPGSTPGEDLPDPLSISLQSTSPFTATVNEPIDAIDLKYFASISGGSGSVNDLFWSVSNPSDLPPGITLSGSSLVGTPTAANQYDFEIVATHVDANDPAKQIYTIIVNGVQIKVTQISAGTAHTCALTTSGGVKCWGWDSFGQLGNDTALTDQPTPVDVQGLTSGVSAVVAGNYHTCAVTTSGGVKCWGRDAQGQLGDDTPLTNQPTPVNVSGLTSGVSTVSAGASHTCAITTSGGVKCWGNGGQGQLGNDAALTNQPTPVNVSGLTSGVSSVAAGGDHTCAVMTSGGLKCWGYDVFGQLGNDTSLTNQPTPVDVLGLTSGVSTVSAGGLHTCALTTSGGVKCWGWGYYGQLGNDAALVNQPIPVDVQGLTSGVSSVSAGGGHTCAVTTSGGLKCWGRDAQGQLGNDTALTDQPTSVDVYGLTSGVSTVSAGGSHTCAVTTSGGLKCWGNDGNGQLGNDTALVNQTAPIDVSF